MSDFFTAWQPTIQIEDSEIDLREIDITIQPLTLEPEPTYWNLEHLRSLETYKGFSNWTEQRKYYHKSDFIILCWMDKARFIGDSEIEGWLREILQVGEIQRRVECGYYKFTPKQVATAKTLSDIKASEKARGVFLDSITCRGTITYPNTIPQEISE